MLGKHSVEHPQFWLFGATHLTFSSAEKWHNVCEARNWSPNIYRHGLLPGKTLQHDSNPSFMNCFSFVCDQAMKRPCCFGPGLRLYVNSVEKNAVNYAMFPPKKLCDCSSRLKVQSESLFHADNVSWSAMCCLGESLEACMCKSHQFQSHCFWCKLAGNNSNRQRNRMKEQDLGAVLKGGQRLEISILGLFFREWVWLSGTSGTRKTLT